MHTPVDEFSLEAQGTLNSHETQHIMVESPFMFLMYFLNKAEQFHSQ